MAPRNLLNLERVNKSFGRAPVLDAVSLGVAAGERIGVVGRNGGGKSTLLKVMAGAEPADSGRVTRSGDLRLGVLDQSGVVSANLTVREYIVGEVDTHDWASQAATREVLDHLLGGYADDALDRTLGGLSGGEIRRVELARLLTQELDLLLLDEPTNHLDVEAIAWLAGHLRARRNLALIVVTHDR
ncbi:MAG: ATP-binding cassette domain-containing protein, partial [Candidatus Nanopelagicales bacterium]|nr:ATP-binding cassette domain-containing protein [Candidatus Nanopelagicales bacterium]